MRSVSVKVIIIFILMIFPLNFLAIFQADAMISNTVEQVKMAEQNVVDVYANMLKTRMDNAASMLHYFRTEDPDCLSMSVQTEAEAYEYKSSKQKLYAKLRNMSGMIDGAKGYYYYFPKVDDILVGGDFYMRGDQVLKLKEAVSGDSLGSGLSGWHIYAQDGISYALLFVRLKNISYGAWINLNDISKSVRKGIEYENITLAFSEKGGEEETCQDMICVSADSKGLKMTLGLERDEVIRTNAIYQKMMFIMALIYLALIPMLYFVMRRLLIKPLKNINDAHRQLRKGNQDYRLEEKASSKEFVEAYHSFNKMAENLKELRIQAYESKIEKQQMELRNLQLQIRPHFLLNTFNLIYSLAEKKESTPIENITIYLSEYFRFIFRSGKEMELFSKELRLITGYIYMAAIRYENLIELSVDLDPEIEFVRTPPLLIHNFVENAVKYGFRQGKLLHIDLQGRYGEGIVTFQITDDGGGMEPEVMERNQKIFRGELVPEDKNAHLGLYNSYKRLKYFYGEEASVEVRSDPGEMTCFTICFPYNLEVDDESFDGK